MLQLKIEEQSFFIDKLGQFVDIKPVVLQLEHSLISVKKWEQKWHKPFLSRNEKDAKTREEIRDYIRCMTINTNVDPMVYYAITEEQEMEVVKYIEDPMTATWFSENNNVGAASSSSEVVTNEIIYYWMITLNIPFACEKWHLNSLLTLIKVVNIKSQPSRKMSASEAAAQRRALNNARRAKYNSRG